MRWIVDKENENSSSCFSIDDCQKSVPAAGYRNGTSSNNVGSNGNYWSSTPNESNTQNAYNLNFNSGNHNRNWNNRNNGQSVRPVSELTSTYSKVSSHFSVSKEQLLRDLYHAYKDARKHKQYRQYQLKFEYNLEYNLVELRDELFNRTYKPRPSICFIIHDPKMREVFAANFRDRIVHHLLYNYTYKLFENSFIYDSYSCIKKRGTHFGVNRLIHHIRSASNNYKKKCHVLKIDIRGYFMHINRRILLDICRYTLLKQAKHKSEVCNKKWDEVIDYNFVEYLLNVVINTDPMSDCIVLGDRNEWILLPKEKSMMHTHEDCGLPIGNLSSQLFSNIYMNMFDQFVKRELKCKHYGRYVDDAYIVGNKSRLKSIVDNIRQFLHDNLCLDLNEDKLIIYDVDRGVEFLGAFVKPFRTYPAMSTLKRICRRVERMDWNNVEYMYASTNSLIGVMVHHESYAMRRVLFGNNAMLTRYGKFDSEWTRYIVASKHAGRFFMG